MGLPCPLGIAHDFPANLLLSLALTLKFCTKKIFSFFKLVNQLLYISQSISLSNPIRTKKFVASFRLHIFWIHKHTKNNFANICHLDLVLVQ